jgi:hypothetical protein
MGGAPCATPSKKYQGMSLFILGGFVILGGVEEVFFGGKAKKFFCMF